MRSNTSRCISSSRTASYLLLLAGNNLSDVKGVCKSTPSPKSRTSWRDLLYHVKLHAANSQNPKSLTTALVQSMSQKSIIERRM
ncbi:hypothetical protein M758_7G097100 [Ceratodon purpureus]|nr:hypothetical protein M758_7G097100 [Ceratodon purpureus]